MLVNKQRITDYLVKVKRGEIEEGLTIGHEDIDNHIRFKRPIDTRGGRENRAVLFRG